MNEERESFLPAPKFQADGSLPESTWALFERQFAAYVLCDNRGRFAVYYAERERLSCISAGR